MLTMKRDLFDDLIWKQMKMRMMKMMDLLRMMNDKTQMQ